MEIGHQGEGTGTRPDYLVNRVLTKNEGQHPEKFVRKSRNSCSVNSGVTSIVQTYLLVPNCFQQSWDRIYRSQSNQSLVWYSKQTHARKFELRVCGLTRETLNEFSTLSLSGSSNLWVSF